MDDYVHRINDETRESGVPESILTGLLVGGLRPDLVTIVIPQLPTKHIHEFISSHGCYSNNSMRRKLQFPFS